MKKIIISVCILLLAVGGIFLYFGWREANTHYQAEPPASHVSEADWVTLAEGEAWIPGWGNVITSDRYYWKDWKRQLNGTESETLYYAHQESWDAFVKIPEGLPQVEEIVICPDRLNKDQTEETE